jgi:hypothetical protein
MSSTLRIIVLLVICVILPHQVSKAGTLSLSGYNRQGVTGWFDGTLKTQYGGRITATFDGKPLHDVYCVQAFNAIGLSTYESKIDGSGIIHGYLVPNAGQISWLVSNVAPTIGSNLDKQTGLQAALWNLSATKGHSFSMSPLADPVAYGYYNRYLADSAGQSELLDQISWISPSNRDLSPAQGLVSSTLFMPVPEPSTYAMALAGLALGGWQMFRRRLAHGGTGVRRRLQGSRGGLSPSARSGHERP